MDAADLSEAGELVGREIPIVRLADERILEAQVRGRRIGAGGLAD